MREAVWSIRQLCGKCNSCVLDSVAVLYPQYHSNRADSSNKFWQTQTHTHTHTLSFTKSVYTSQRWCYIATCTPTVILCWLQCVSTVPSAHNFSFPLKKSILLSWQFSSFFLFVCCNLFCSMKFTEIGWNF